jgi:deoxyribonuclease V
MEDKLPRQIKTVAGVDVSYVGNIGVGASTVLDYESLKLLESQVVICKVKMPYIPTLLSFREISPAMASIRKLKIQPDVFLVDAQGLAHPYRCGFASHLGLVMGKPTIGAAKSRLIGEPVEVNGQTFLVDKGEVIGAVVTTKQGAKPIYVSIGHMVSLETAVKIVKHCAKNRIPEPTLQAHSLATTERIRLAREAK